jgi:hypothetical protein
VKEQIMKQQRQPRISMGWLVVSAIALASAGSFAEDTGIVQSGGGSVNEVYGRASAPIPGANPVRSISSKVDVSKVLGRSSGGPTFSAVKSPC